MNPIEIRFTIDDRAAGDAIAQALLDRHLVACWQRSGPVASRYWWNGEQESAEEWRYAAKTTDARLGDVVAAVAALHPYDVPEIIATPIVGGAADYLRWIDAETDPTREA